MTQLPFLNITKVIDTTGFTQSGDEFIGKHPTLPETELKVNTKDNTWYLDTGIGGDAWLWLACSCGAVDWLWASQDALDNASVLNDAKIKAVKLGLFKQENLFPESSNRFHIEQEETEPNINQDSPSDFIESVRRELSTFINVDEDSGSTSVDQIGCVHALIDNFNIITLPKDDEVLYYENGLYKPNADILMSKILRYAFLDFADLKGKPIYKTHVRNEILNSIKDLTPKIGYEFDPDLNLINMANGMYNWSTQKFIDHDPKYMSRIQIPVNYDPNATCPNILHYIDVTFKPEDKQKVLEFIGYCLYRSYPIQKAFILLGPGGTGKSTFLTILRKFVGEDHAEVISPQDLSKDKFSGIDLKGKLLNAPADIGSDELEQTAFIKCLVGIDKTRGQKKFMDASAFTNFAKQIFGMNRLPSTKDRSTGWYRRIEILHMDHVLGENEFSTEFLASLTSVSELSGLFNLAVQALSTLMHQKHFTNQTSIEDTQALYEAASRPEETFCDRFMKNVPNSIATKEDIYLSYKIFCKKSGAVAQSSNKLSAHIHKHVEWCPKTKNPNDEKGWIKGKTTSVWLDTEFDAEEWVNWCQANEEEI